MIFLRHRWNSRRRTPLWVLMLGMRQPRVAPATSTRDEVAGIGVEDVVHRDHHRWRRSLRAPMVLRLCLGMRRDATDRAGSPA